MIKVIFENGPGIEGEGACVSNGIGIVSDEQIKEGFKRLWELNGEAIKKACQSMPPGGSD